MSLKYNSPVILTFAILCSAIYVIDESTPGNLMNLFSVGISVDWTSPESVFNLVSHIFGHAGLDHLMGNMTFILLLGPIIEEKYGSRFTLFSILATGLITGLLNVAFFSTGLMGASGIVFMLILLVSFTNVSRGEIPLTFILVALLFVGKEVLHSLKADQVSQFAHIIGGACGSLFGFLGKDQSPSASTLDSY